MQGTPLAMAGLQDAINLEISLSLQYALFRDDCKRFGLSIAEGWQDLHEQCESFAQQLTSRLLFLEGEPKLTPAPAGPLDDVAQMLAAANQAELALLAKYTGICRQCWEEGDLDNFHFFQHLAKWHRQGGNDYKGHLSWIQMQAWQLKNTGETGYITAKIIG